MAAESPTDQRASVLVTGGAGFIGSHLTDRLSALGHRVLAIDNLATGRRENLAEPPGSVELVEASIADGPALDDAFERLQPSLVVHCAASYRDPEAWDEDARTNVSGTINVVRAAQRHGVRRLIYFQTALCYGNRPDEQPVTLSHPLRPQGSYAISKTAAEQYIAQSGLDYVSLRLANVYGPRNLSGPVPVFFSRLSQGKGCYAVRTRRDFVYVDDLVDVAVRFAHGEGRGGVYHVSSGADVSIPELYDLVSSAMGVDRPAEVRDPGPDDVPTILLDPSRTVDELGWRPATPLEDGIGATVRWYQAHGVGDTYTHLRGRG